MKLIVHIGLSKTGTSAIQNFFWENRKILLEKYRILYPETGISNAGNKVIGDIYAHYILYRAIKYKKSLPDLLKKLEREIASKDPDYIFLSCENFMHFKDNDLKIFKEILQNITNYVTIVIYLRRQDKWIESSYAQDIKTGDIYYDFKTYITKGHNVWLLNMYGLLKRWQNFFSDSKFIVRIYDKTLFLQNNVLYDFLEATNFIYVLNALDQEKLNKLFVNPSLSYLNINVLKKINEEFVLPKEFREKILKFLLDIQINDKLKTFFTLKERIEFLERFRKPNEKLFREWFNSENKFVLSEKEIEFYKQQDKIPKEEIEKAVEERFNQIIEFLKQDIPNLKKYKRNRYVQIFDEVNLKDNEVYGFVDIMNHEIIAGWVADLEENNSTEVVLKINDIPVITKIANKRRKDVIEKIGKDINTGFEIFWKEINLPKEIKNLPDNTICKVEIVHKRTNKVIQGNYRDFTVKDLMKFSQSLCEVNINYNMSEEIQRIIEIFDVDMLYKDLLNEGRLIIGGIVILKENFNINDYKLVLETREGEKEVTWNFPSPGYAQKLPNNLNAKNARFRIEGIRILKEFPVKLCLLNTITNEKLKLLEVENVSD